MILGNIHNALKFAVEAQKDWVVPIPEKDLEDMASYLSTDFNGTYLKYFEGRYGTMDNTT